jgi:mRNA-degrading endonuclease RelE of RelBE toxin-antitoxin system
MVWNIELSPEAQKDLKKLGTQELEATNLRVLMAF